MSTARRAAYRLARRILPRMPPEAREIALALAARAGTGPAVLPGVPPGPVLVPAPHPDDEAFGCGGALARHAGAGDAVTVVVATSGGATRGGGKDVERVREAESRAARAALDLGEPVFLRLPDGALATCTEPLAEALRELGRDASGRLRPRARRPPPRPPRLQPRAGGGRLAAEALGYEVWSPAPADVVLDVGGVWARKEQARRCYPVALESVDYLAAAVGLAAYRGATAGLGPGARAEAFTRLAPADHAVLAARL